MMGQTCIIVKLFCLLQSLLSVNSIGFHSLLIKLSCLCVCVYLVSAYTLLGRYAIMGTLDFTFTLYIDLSSAHY